MTVAGMATLIGRDAQWHTNGLAIAVTIVDVKQAWGKLRYQITPAAGDGTVWVEGLGLPEAAPMTVPTASNPSLTA